MERYRVKKSNNNNNNNEYEENINVYFKNYNNSYRNYFEKNDIIKFYKMINDTNNNIVYDYFKINNSKIIESSDSDICKYYVFSMLKTNNIPNLFNVYDLKLNSDGYKLFNDTNIYKG